MNLAGNFSNRIPQLVVFRYLQNKYFTVRLLKNRFEHLRVIKPLYSIILYRGRKLFWYYADNVCDERGIRLIIPIVILLD